MAAPSSVPILSLVFDRPSHLHLGPRSSAVYIGVALVSLQAAFYISRAGTSIPKPLVALLALAGGAVMFAISSERLLLGWLFLAPVLQESAGAQRVGSLLGLVLYTAPPAVLATKTILARGPRPALRWFDIVPILYVLYAFGSLAIASNALQADAVGTSRAFYQTVALGAVMYYVIVFWPGRGIAAAKVCGVVLAAVALQAAMSILEAGTGWNLWNDLGWRRAGEVQRSIATLANPALLGAFIGVGIVVALAVLCWDGPRQLRRLAGVVLMLGPGGLVFTYTRGPILATLLMAVPVMLLSPRTRLIGIGAVVVAAIAIFAAWPRITSSEVYETRIAQRANVQTRVVLQQVSVELAAQKPLFGWGYGSFDLVKYDVKLDNPSASVAVALQSTSHNTYLTVLVENGGLGVLLFFLPIVAVCSSALRRVRLRDPERWLYVAAVGAIGVVVLSASTFDLRFFSFIPMLTWLFLGLARRAKDDGAARPAA